MTTTAESTSVRDIPRSCSCDWKYHRWLARWIITRREPTCIWHQRNGDQP